MTSSSSNSSFDEINNRIVRMMGESSHRSSILHGQFLTYRRNGLHQLHRMINQQLLSVANGHSLSNQLDKDRQKVVYDNHQLDEFGAGRISACFGPAFTRYDGMQIPRIPNGDLKMMTRVTDIQGEPGNFSSPASIEVEYDVPLDAWYLNENSPGGIPYSLLMEIALQPCGFLSAYLDTYALVPHRKFFFRNLDGKAQVVGPDICLNDLRGKTIITQARLLSNIVSAGTVIQKFYFIVRFLPDEGERRLILYEGESTFGYFSAESMVNQVGLDGGQKVQPWYQNQPGLSGEIISLSGYRTHIGKKGLHLPVGRLGLLENARFLNLGGKFEKGYLYAQRPVNPGDWFYPFHFHGDPVMPGSLGVECIYELLKTYALIAGLGRGMQTASFSLPVSGLSTTWCYRGQITPAHRMTEFEIHLKEIRQRKGEITLSCDANVWVDGLRIYEIKDAGIRIIEE